MGFQNVEITFDSLYLESFKDFLLKGGDLKLNGSRASEKVVVTLRGFSNHDLLGDEHIFDSLIVSDGQHRAHVTVSIKSDSDNLSGTVTYQKHSDRMSEAE